MSTPISFDDFLAVDIRAGTIVAAEPFPEARKPAIKLWVDFGPELGTRKSSAQITVHYTPEMLIGRQVIAVTNFPPRQVGKFMSEVLVLGLPDDNGAVVLLAPDHKVPNGGGGGCTSGLRAAPSTTCAAQTARCRPACPAAPSATARQQRRSVAPTACQEGHAHCSTCNG